MNFQNEKAIAGFFGGLYQQMTRNLLAKLAAINPAVATQAQIDELYGEFDKLSEQVIEAKSGKNGWDKEQKEADVKVAEYNMQYRTAEILSEKAERETDPDKKAALEQSRDKQIAAVEALVPDMEREVREAKEAKEMYDEMRSFIAEFAEKLKATEAAMAQAQRDLQSANISKQRSEMRENVVAASVGLRKQELGSTAILGALQNAADKTRKEADAANLRADLLKKKDLAEEDPNIKAAMEEAAGHTPTSNLSFAERMALLKPKTTPVS